MFAKNPIGAMRSASVAPEVSLRNPLHTGFMMKHASEGIRPGFETQSRYYQSSEKGVSVVSQKGLISLKIFF